MDSTMKDSNHDPLDRNKPGISRQVLGEINKSVGQASGLPNHAYTDPEFFKLEIEEIFARTWTCIGNACSVPGPGDLKTVSFLGSPLLLCRDNNSRVRVYHNVCSHRGNELVWKSGHVNGVITCPYHAWCYGLDGTLLATPHIGGKDINHVETLDREKHGLKAARSAVWMDLVFVNLSGDAPMFDDYIAPLQARIDRLASRNQFETLRPASSHGQLTIKFSGNWKLNVENNLDAYHLPWVHPDLNSVSKFEDHYYYCEANLFAGQGSNNYDHEQIRHMTLPMFEGWPEKVAEYPTLFPNVFLGFHCDHYWSRIVEPVSECETLDHLQIYYPGEAADSDEFESSRKTRFQVWEKVFKEDIEVVEGMQRGRMSRAFSGGVFSPALDSPSHYFAKWLANQLGKT
jgi:choline monooxygenase